ncbi:hypothetical protein AAGT00_29310 [Streptomyces cavourensis]
MPDPAGDGGHVQGPRAQRRVVAAERVQGVQGGRVAREVTPTVAWRPSASRSIRSAGATVTPWPGTRRGPGR